MGANVEILKTQAKLMKEYYKYFSKYSKGKEPDKKVAWVTAFTPVEILEALDISYYYPESYAAVIAASGKEQDFLETSQRDGLSLDCCSYSCCIQGSICNADGPRGTAPRPDVLIATNNQCNTLPNWWNILAERYDVPLIVLDYPGENVPREMAEKYVYNQHKKLIKQMEELSGNKLDMAILEEKISNSQKSVEAWEKIVELMPERQIEPTLLFDGISFLITSRCDEKTSRLYELLAEDYSENYPKRQEGKAKAFWLGYPLWYHENRYLKESLDSFEIVGSNYITWWSLSYEGDDVFKKLFSAYNFTFLNLSQQERTKRLVHLIEKSGAKCAITLHNKSCKCDFVSASEIKIPQAELDIDMIDRNYMDMDRAKEKIGILQDIVG
ncbi:MAG: 2-hydroxyacyl-CoA dehydratase family protein [Lachnospiraceae bacterium]|nr:2-hydroxyacyl-CoA dehydratase family protein [Lachnospiraceae bacterium]